MTWARLGSRSTFHIHAAAARDGPLRAKLQALAAEAGLPSGTNYGASEIFMQRYGMQAGNVIGTATYMSTYQSPGKDDGMSDNVTPFWMIGGTGAEVEVDTETGHVHIARLVNVADCGTPINPRIAHA